MKRLLIDEMTALDPQGRQVRLRAGGVLDYAVLSLNVGSTLTPPNVGAARLLTLRPLGQLRLAWETLLAELAASAFGTSNGPSRCPRRVSLQYAWGRCFHTICAAH